MDWSEHADAALLQEMIGWRRHLHANPEVSFEEHQTTAFIAHLLDAWNVPYDRPLKTGVVAHITGSRPGPVVAVRADIDALPIQEENDFDFASQYPGRMHACGHDGHTAVLLGLTKVLAEIRDQVYGEIRLIFQPAEEVIASGARHLIEKGILKDVKIALGLHLWSNLETGKVSLRAGPIMASTDEFKITVIGSGGHAAQPHETVDSLVIASSLVGELQTLVSRRTDPLEPAVVTVGTFHAGSASNVVPGRAELTGTVRTLSDRARELIERELSTLARGHARAQGADVEVTYVRGNPSVVNHGGLSEFLRPALTAAAGAEERLVSLPPIMGGEDFAYYGEVVPSMFFFVGARNPEVGAVFPHHHPRFTVDERALDVGVRCFLEALERTSAQPGFEALSLDVTPAAGGLV